MKSKYLLMSLALAGGFAACSQEEILTEQQSVQSKVIEKSLGQLTFNVTGDTESRMTGSSWDNQDILGLVWFNPSYQAGEGAVEMGNGCLWANNPFYFVDGSQSDFQSKTNVMEGTHIAYYPYQTVWGDDKVQQIAGKELLKVYAAAEQKTDLNDRYDWMREHTNMFSKVHTLTGDKAGLSKTNEIAMKQFNNIVAVSPEFVNCPADLTIEKYYFEAKSAVFPTAGTVNPYNEAWPRMQKDFLNGWTAFTALSEIYTPTAMSKTVSVAYDEAISFEDAAGFGFTLLPVSTEDLGKVSKKSHGITLYAETNYGKIPVTTVTVRMGDKMDGAIEEESTLNKIFYGADDCTIPTDWERYGLVNKAGYTITMKAEFDFENVEAQKIYPDVCDNDELDAALTRIGTYKSLLGAGYTEATIVLCENATFTTMGEDGDFWQYIDDNDSGVNVSVEGMIIAEEPATTITWVGKHYLSKEIPNVKLNIAAPAETRSASATELAADKTFEQNWEVTGELVNNGNATGTITVKAAGNFTNNKTATDVVVEEGGNGLNLGYVEYLTNAGKFTNGKSSVTPVTAQQIVIEYLNNSGSVVNYTTIEFVAENEGGTIELKKAKGKNLFSIGAVAWNENDNRVEFKAVAFPEFEESVEKIGKIFAKVATDASVAENQQAYQAGEDVLKAMENFANEVIISAAQVDFRNHTSQFRRNCCYNAKYTNIVANGEVEFISDNRLTASILLVRKLTVNKGKSLKLSNFNNELVDFAYSTAAYVALSVEMNENSTLFVNGQAVLVAPVMNFNGNGVTLDGANKKKSFIYSLPLNASNLTIGNVTLNQIEGLNVDALIDELLEKGMPA